MSRIPRKNAHLAGVSDASQSTRHRREICEECETRFATQQFRDERRDARTDDTLTNLDLARSCAPIPISLLASYQGIHELRRVARSAGLLWASASSTVSSTDLSARAHPRKHPTRTNEFVVLHTCVLAREYWYHCQDSMGRLQHEQFKSWRRKL